MPFCGFWFCACRNCCCCCKSCAGGCCGAKYPTKGGGCCGFDKRADGSFGYSTCCRVASLLYTTFFILSVLGAAALGHFLGSATLGDTLKAFSHAPSGIADMVTGAVDPTAEFAVNLGSDALRNFIGGFRDVITDGTDLGAIADDIDCIIDRVDELPDTGILLDWIDGAELRVVEISDTLNSIPPFLDEIEAQNVAISLAAADAVAFLEETDASIEAVKENTIATKASMGNISTLISNMNDPDNGMPKILEELAAVQEVPDQSEVDAATTDTTGSLAQLVGESGPELRGMDGSGVVARSHRSDLITNLGVIQTTYQAMPNYTLTAQRMRDFNALLAEAVENEIVPTLKANIIGTDAAIQTLPVAENVTAVVDALVAEVNALDLTPMIEAVLAVNSSLARFPDSQVLLDEVVKVERIRALVPCLFQFSEDIAPLNNSLVLPPEVDDIANKAVELNATVEDTIAGAHDARDQVENFEESKSNLDLNQTLFDLRSTQATLSESKADLNATTNDLVGSMDAMEEGTELDLSILDQLDDLQTSLENNTLDEGVIQDVDAFQGAIDALLANLDETLTDVETYDLGYCSDETSTLCRDVSDCSSGTCESEGEQRCTDDPTQSCSSDGDCGDRCLTDFVRMRATSSVIREIEVPDVTSATDSLSDIDSKDDVDLDGFSADLDDALASMDDVNVGDTANQIDEVVESTGEFSVEDARSEFGDVQEDVDAIDFGDIRADLTSVDSDLEEIDSQIPQLEEFAEILSGLDTMFTEDTPTFLTRLDATALNDIRAAAGLGSVVVEVAEVLDDFSLALNRSIGDMLPLPLYMNASGSVAGVVDSMNFADSPQHREAGSLYYLASVTGSGEGSPRDSMFGKIIDASDPIAYRMQVDEGGNEYPEGAQCFSQACLDREIEYATEKPLADYMPDLPAPIPLALPLVMSALFVLPILVVLLTAGCAAMCSFCKRCSGCARCCSTCQVCTICTMSPLLWIFIGAIFFPMMLLMGDVCYSMESIGYSFVTEQSSAACESVPGGVEDGDMCSGELALMGNQTIEFSLSVSAVYEGMMWGCDPNEDDPLISAFESIGDGMEAFPVDFIEMVLDATDDSPLGFREVLKEVFRRFAGSFGGHASAWILSIGRNTMSCSALHGMWVAIKGPICCEFLSMLLALVAAWYLIIVCCCTTGVSSGIIGRKRLPKKLWGKEYQDCLNVDGAGGVAAAADAAGDDGAAGGGGGGAADPAAVELVIDPVALPPALTTSRIGARVLPRAYPEVAETGGDAEPAHQTVSQMLEAIAAGELGNGPAMHIGTEGGDGSVEEMRSLTWKQLLAEVDATSKGLTKLGVTMQDTIAIIGTQSSEWTLAHLGAASIGAIPAGIHAFYNNDTIAEMVGRVRASVVVTTSADEARVLIGRGAELPELRTVVIAGAAVESTGIPDDVADGVGVSVMSWSAMIRGGRKVKDKSIKQAKKDVTPHHCAAICFTAGSRTEHLAVMLSHDNLTWTGRAVAEAMQLTAADRLVHVCDPEHAFALAMFIYAPMHAGAVVHYPAFSKIDRAALDVSAAARILKDALPTVVVQSGRQWGELYHFSLRSGDSAGPTAVRSLLGLSDARLGVAVAGHLSPLVRAAIEGMGVPVVDSYGVTEASGVVSLSLEQGPDSKGIPLRGVGVKVGSGLSPEDKELSINGRNVMMGYVGNDDATRAAVSDDGWLHTGDDGTVDPQRNILFHGAPGDRIVLKDGRTADAAFVEAIVESALPIAAHAIVVGAGRDHLGVLISLRLDGVPTSAEQAPLAPEVIAVGNTIGSTAKTLEEVMSDPFYVSYITQQLGAVNEALRAARMPEVVRYQLLIDPVGVHLGHLGPPQRVRRFVVDHNFSYHIVTLYQGPAIVGTQETPPAAAGATATASGGAGGAAAAAPAAPLNRASGATPVPVAAGATAVVAPVAPSFKSKTGYMRKLGSQVKNWKHRYFILDHDRLSYYTKPGGKLKGELVMGKDSSIAATDKGQGATKEGSAQVENGFALRAKGGRVLICECTSAAERDEWMEALWNNIRALT